MSKHILIVDARELETIRLALRELRVVLEENRGLYPADLREQIASHGVLRLEEYAGLIEKLGKQTPTLVMHTHAGGITHYLEDNADAAADRVVQLAREDHDDRDDPQYEDLYSNDPSTAYAAAEDYFRDHAEEYYDIVGHEDLV